MPFGRSFTTRNLGFSSYVSPPNPVTGVAVSAAANSGAAPNDYTATATWTLPSDTNLKAVFVQWSINSGAYGAATEYSKTTTSATKVVAGGQTARARVYTQNVSNVTSATAVSSTVTVPPSAVTSYSVTNSATPGTVDISWTNPSNISGLTLERNGGTTASFSLGPSDTSYTDSPGSSFSIDYVLTASNSGGTGVSTSSSVTTAPKVPTIVSFTASNPGVLTLNATAPTMSNVDGYDVQLKTGSTWGVTIDTGTNPDHVWSTAVDGTSYQARVRTRDTFGAVSAWATSSTATGINDTTGPVVPTPTAVWDQSLPGFTISWTGVTDASSAVDTVYLQVSYDGGTTVSNLSTTANKNGGSYDHTLTSGRRGDSIKYRMRAADTYGNITQGTWRTVTAKPLGTFYVLAASTASWETGGTAAWRTDTDDVVSGFADATYGTQTGYWFYGTGINDTCKGYDPDSGTISMYRNGTLGSTGYNNIALHSHTTKPTTPSYASATEDVGPYISGSGGSAVYTLPSSWLAHFGNNAYKGVAAVDSGSYRRLLGTSGNSYSGMLTLVFN